MKNLLLLLLAFGIVFFSCTKDEEVDDVEEVVDMEYPLMTGDTISEANLKILPLNSFYGILEIDLTGDLVADLSFNLFTDEDLTGGIWGRGDLEIKNPAVKVAVGEKIDSTCYYNYFGAEPNPNGDSTEYRIMNECIPVPGQEPDSMIIIKDTYVKGFDAGVAINEIEEWSEKNDYPLLVFTNFNYHAWQVVNYYRILGFWEDSYDKNYIAFKYEKEGTTKYGWLNIGMDLGCCKVTSLVYQE